MTGFAHRALFYEGPEQFAERTGSFVKDGLAGGEAVLVVAPPDHTALLAAALGGDGERVEFVDMTALGRNPARLIPAWQDWIDRNAAGGRRFRGVGEPVFAGRGAAELVECGLHEHLLNTAFEGGPAWQLLCPYDTGVLSSEAIMTAHHTHPDDPDYRQDTSAFDEPLPEPSRQVEPFAFTLGDLAQVRKLVATTAGGAGLPSARVQDLVLAASEIAANSIRHGGGSGVLRVWAEPDAVVVETRDHGVITDPLAGRIRPDGQAEGSAGLWLVNQVCDLVQIRSSPADGTVVRVRMDRAHQPPPPG